jgi:hypothetical protein
MSSQVGAGALVKRACDKWVQAVHHMEMRLRSTAWVQAPRTGSRCLRAPDMKLHDGLQGGGAKNTHCREDWGHGCLRTHGRAYERWPWARSCIDKKLTLPEAMKQCKQCMNICHGEHQHAPIAHHHARRCT